MTITRIAIILIENGYENNLYHKSVRTELRIENAFLLNYYIYLLQGFIIAGGTVLCKVRFLCVLYTISRCENCELINLS